MDSSLESQFKAVNPFYKSKPSNKAKSNKLVDRTPYNGLLNLFGDPSSDKNFEEVRREKPKKKVPKKEALKKSFEETAEIKSLKEKLDTCYQTIKQKNDKLSELNTLILSMLSQLKDLISKNCTSEIRMHFMKNPLQLFGDRFSIIVDELKKIIDDSNNENRLKEGQSHLINVDAMVLDKDQFESLKSAKETNF